MDPKAILTIGEIADRAGLATSAVRFYESKGLISSDRTAGNQRRYARHTLRRLAIVKAAQRMGIPLSRVQQAFEQLPDGRAPNAVEWQTFSAEWKAELDARIAVLTTLRDGLDGCIGCGCLSVERCPIYNTDDKLAAEGTGSRTIERLWQST